MRHFNRVGRVVAFGQREEALSNCPSKENIKQYDLNGSRLTAIILPMIIFCVLFSVPDLLGARAYAQTPQQRDTLKQVSNGSKNQDLAIANMLQQKKEFKLNHDYNKPFAAHGNGVENEAVLYQSLLTGYQKGFKSHTIREGAAFVDSKYSINNGKAYRLGCYNSSLINIYQMAFLNDKLKFPHNRIVFEVSDRSKFMSRATGKEAIQWIEENGYCYELIMPVALGRSSMYEQMRRDLLRMFPQYKVSIEKRDMECYALIRTSNQDKLKTRGGEAGGKWDQFGFRMQNYYGLSYFLLQLEYYLQRELPIIDKTGYEGTIDIDIKANLSSIEELNKALAAYDLKFSREKLSMDVLVIADSGIEPVDYEPNPADYANEPRGFDWLPLKKGESKR